MTLVLDASAVVAYLLRGDRGKAVGRLLAESGEPPWTVPLVDAEVGHALRGMVMRKALAPGRASRALDALALMRLVRTGHMHLMDEAWQLRNNLSFYDALYVALAGKIDATLVTLDTRLASAPKLPAKVVVP